MKSAQSIQVQKSSFILQEITVCVLLSVQREWNAQAARMHNPSVPVYRICLCKSTLGKYRQREMMFLQLITTESSVGTEYHRQRNGLLSCLLDLFQESYV